MKYFIYVFVLAISFNLNSENGHHLCEGYFPPNDANIPVTSTFINGEPTGISEEEFHEALDRIERVYQPVVSARGETLIINRLWEDGTVNANVKKVKKNQWLINMYGGMARHKFATFDSFISVACHEIGHMFGGGPTRGIYLRYMSAEGQADYFTAAKCMRKLFSYQENLDYLDSNNLHPYPKMICDLMYKDENDVDRLANCYRSSQAGYDQALIYKDLSDGNGKSFPVSWDAPIDKTVRRSFFGHPKPQCRLNTYLRGAACGLDHNIDFEADMSRKELNMGACHREMKNTEFYKKLKEANTEVITDKNLPEHINARPLCWYKPGDGRWKVF